MSIFRVITEKFEMTVREKNKQKKCEYFHLVEEEEVCEVSSCSQINSLAGLGRHSLTIMLLMIMMIIIRVSHFYTFLS